MISARDERALAMRERIEGWRKAKLVNDESAHTMRERFATPWRSSGLLARIVGFALTAAGVALFAAFCELLFDTQLPAAVLSLAAAEWLIRKRWWSTGIESALFIGSLCTFIFSLPGEGKPEALLLFALAGLIGFLRLRQPLFGAAAVLFVLIYLQEKNLQFVAFLAGIAAGVLALLLLHKTWNRPSSEWLVIALLITGPPVGYFAGDDLFLPLATAAMFFILAAIFLVSGVRLRHHAPFLAAAIAIIIVSSELHDFLPLLTEAKLAFAGANLLLLAAILSRALRGRTSGFVAAPPPRTDADELLDLGGAIVAIPEQPAASTSDGRPQGDGGFGGAGATGDF